MYRKKIPWSVRLALIITIAAISFGLASDPVAAQVKTNEMVASHTFKPVVMLRLPGDYVRWSYTLSVKRTDEVKRWVLRNENMSTALVMGVSGTLCGLLGLYGSPVVAAIAAGSCATLIGMYWGALKDAVHHITPSRPRLRLVDTCNYFALAFGGACRLSFQNIPK